MLPKPTLSPTAENGIRELRDDHGIEPTLDEIIWLHELGKVVEDPTRERLDLIGLPARAGNAWFWPMTVMAGTWYLELAVPWFGHDPKMGAFALAFALAHGRGKAIPDRTRRGWLERLFGRAAGWTPEPITLDSLTDRNAAWVAVRSWARSLACTQAELEAAIDAAMPQSEPEKQPDNASRGSIDWQQIVHDLALLTGTDPEYWRTRPSRDALIRAYSRAVTIQAARSGTGAAPLGDPTADAIKAFRQAMVAIIKAHKEIARG